MIKVNNTVSHKTSMREHGQGDVIVTKGKLIIPMRNNNNDYKGWLKPIIISETEKIEVGDHATYGTDVKIIKEFEKDFTFFTDYTFWHSADGNCVKILALPEHFSPKQLQAIVNGKLKDGDEVYVECENINLAARGNISHKSILSNCNNWVCCIKLNSDNHITLHKVEQKMYTKDEVKQLIQTVVCDFDETISGYHNPKVGIDYTNRWCKDNL